MFHTVFNLVPVIIVLPLTNLLVKLVTKIVPDKKKEPSDNAVGKFRFVEEHMLKTPPLAVQQVKNEISAMAETAIKNFNCSCDIVCSLDYSRIEEFRAREENLNFLNKELVRFIVRLLREDLNEKDRVFLTTAIKSVTDLERVGDYAENIVEYADRLKESEESFSENAVREIKDLNSLIGNLYKEVMTAYKNNDRQALKNALSIEQTVDDVTAEMTESHISRLNGGQCVADVGAQFLSLTANAERIADHFINVAKTIKNF